VARAVNGIFGLIVRPVVSYQWRDRIMAGQAAVILLGQLAVWLVSFYVGYALLIWPTTHSIGTAFRSVGPALWTFGSPDTHGFFETAVLVTAAMAGLVTVTLQIAYLPALYAAFNRRENEIALLNSRAGGDRCQGRDTLCQPFQRLSVCEKAVRDGPPGRVGHGSWSRSGSGLSGRSGAMFAVRLTNQPGLLPVGSRSSTRRENSPNRLARGPGRCLPGGLFG
jgi:predicted permease